MKRRHAWPKGHWSWPVDITHKHGMRSGSMIWIGGQLDMTESGEVCHAGDVFAQIPPVVRHVERVLEEGFRFIMSAPVKTYGAIEKAKELIKGAAAR